MAQEIATDSKQRSQSPSQPRKKRRLSINTRSRIANARRHNALLSQSSTSFGPASAGSPVAFSNSGLIAHQDGQQPGQLCVAISPLSSPFSAKPLQLYAPVSPHPYAYYKVTRILFSHDGLAIAVVIQPDPDRISVLDLATLSGLFCIWTNRPGTFAINQAWDLTASLPLAADSPLGTDLIGLYWLDGSDQQQYIVKQPLSPPSQPAAAHEPPQLPGMTNDSGKHNQQNQLFETLKIPPRGPQLISPAGILKGTPSAQGIILVGANGGVHLAHRNATSQQSYPYPPSLASMYAIKPFTLLSASLVSPSLAGPPTDNWPSSASDAIISQVAFHPLIESSKVLVAGTRCSSREILLAEIDVTNHGSPMMTVRPSTSTQWDSHLQTDESIQGHLKDGSALTPISLAFVSSIDVKPQPGLKITEAIKLVMGLVPESPGPRDLSELSLLQPFSLSWSPSDIDQHLLSSAFDALQDRKKSVGEAVIQPQWVVTPEKVLAHPHKTLVQLNQNRYMHVKGNQVANTIRAFWLRSSTDVSEHSACFGDIDVFAEGSDEAPGADGMHHIHLPLPHIPWGHSPHHTIFSGAIDPSRSRSAPLRSSTVTWRRYENVDQQCQSLATSLFEAVCNEVSYDDLLLVSATLLYERKNARAVLGRYASGRGLNRAGTRASLPPQGLLHEFLRMSLKIDNCILQTRRKLLSDADRERLTQRKSTVAWISTSCHRLTALHTARLRPGSNVALAWDADSIPDLLPVAGALIAHCEALARESLLLQKASQSGAPSATTSTAIYILSAHPSFRKVLAASLQLLLDLLAWLQGVTAPESTALEEIVQQLSKELKDYVLLQQTIRKGAVPVGEGSVGEGPSWLDGISPNAPITGIQVAPTNSDPIDPLFGSSSRAGFRDQIFMACESLQDMVERSKVDLRVLKERLSSFDAMMKAEPAHIGKDTAQNSTVDAILNLLGYDDDQDDAKKRCDSASRLAKHLLSETSAALSGATNATASTQTILKQQGASLLLSESDFVETLMDVLGAPNTLKRHRVEREGSTDAVTSAFLASSSGGLQRRDLTTGQMTRYTPQSSGPQFGPAGPNGMIGPMAGSWALNDPLPLLGSQDMSDPSNHLSIAKEFLDRKSVVQRYWDDESCKHGDQWWIE